MQSSHFQYLFLCYYSPQGDIFFKLETSHCKVNLIVNCGFPESNLNFKGQSFWPLLFVKKKEEKNKLDSYSESVILSTETY